LQSKETKLADQKELITAGENQNALRTICLLFGIFIVGNACYSINRAVEAKTIWPYSLLDVTSIIESFTFNFLVHGVGLLTMGIGALLPYRDTENMQANINHTKEKIKQFKAMLAALQTESSNTPETNVTPKTERY